MRGTIQKGINFEGYNTERHNFEGYNTERQYRKVLTLRGTIQKGNTNFEGYNTERQLTIQKGPNFEGTIQKGPNFEGYNTERH